jgi:nicotinamide-nucleotide amidase
MHAIILSIGDELVLGQTVDTNSAWLSARLAGNGIPTLYHHTIADDMPAIVKAIRLASEDADLVIISGGLGPTEDDLTRQALAEAMGVELFEDAASLEQLQRWFAGRGRPMPDRNRVQVLCPRGATMIENTAGTAPGIRAAFGRATFYVTPGVPREMKVMFERSIEPEILASGVMGDRGVILTLKVNTFGAGESTVAEQLGELMDRSRNPKVGTTVANGIVSVRVRSEFPTRDTAQAALDQTVALIHERLGAVVFGTEDDTLQQALVTLLTQHGETVTTAESCTGGMIGEMITDVPGSSAAYVGGWITYSNAQKADRLGVPVAVLEAHGAVSEPVVRAMAEGALERSGATHALAVTGIAGPDGGTADKPVGTIWLGLASTADETQTMLLRLSGDRATIRDRTAKCAMQMLRLRLLDQPLDQLGWAVAPAAAK